MDYDYLVSLRRNHPAWRLLASEHAPFVIALLHRYFIEPNVRTMEEQELSARLEDFLYYLQEHLREKAFPRTAMDYLNDWANDSHGFLRRYYPSGSDEPHYDLTPAAERAIQWLVGLENQVFVGTESRLKLVFELLREIVHGSETDPEARITELEQRRAQIDAEIQAVRAGRMILMDPTQLRERFLQAVEMARGILADFRQLEQNFRDLDREVREKIAAWDGAKGEIIGQVLGDRDAIFDSDQGKSFRAFWHFLMSGARQEELTGLMERVTSLEPIAELRPDQRLRRIHYDWLAAGEQTQRTVARLSEQLRRFLDEQVWLENRRIMTLLHRIEQNALLMRDDPPRQDVMNIDAFAPEIDLPMDRPLFRPSMSIEVASDAIVQGDDDLSVAALFEQVYGDKERLRSALDQILQNRNHVALEELLDRHPLQQGVAELVAWLSIAEEGRGVVDETREIAIKLLDATGSERIVRLPAVSFVADLRRSSS